MLDEPALTVRIYVSLLFVVFIDPTFIVPRVAQVGSFTTHFKHTFLLATSYGANTSDSGCSQPPLPGPRKNRCPSTSSSSSNTAVTTINPAPLTTCFIKNAIISNLTS